MPKKRRLKKKKSKKRSGKRHFSNVPNSDAELRYQQVPSPFEGMSDTEITNHLQKLGEDFEQQYEEGLQDLNNKLLDFDPLLLLAMFGYYGLGLLGESNRNLVNVEPILQHHIELIQAFVLQHQLQDYKLEPVTPQAFESFRVLIQKISTGFMYRRFKTQSTQMPMYHQRRVAVQEVMRLDTQAVRNWSYLPQIIRISSDLFAPIDAEIEAKLGVRVSFLLEMLSKVGEQIEEKMNSHFQTLLPMMRSQSIESVVEEYHLAYQDLRSDQNALLQLFKENDAELDQAKSMLMSHSDLRLRSIFELTLNDFVNNYPDKIDKERIEAVLNVWALSFGELSGENSEYFFMGNPVWEKPLIRLNEENVFWPIPTLLQSFCISLMEQIIRPYPNLYKKYEERRGKFLEEQVEELFRSSIPASNVYKGSQWTDPNTNKLFENDLLVKVDTQLIIVEAKSAKVTAPARRGAERRLQRTIDELIIESSSQANRFAKFLQNNPGLHNFSTLSGHVNTIDTSDVREVIRLSVTLEPLGMIQTRLPELQKAGFIGRDFDFAPAILLTDLEVILTTLNSTCEKLHYLRRRAQFERNSNYYGDEIDLLAFYLNTGFNVGEAEFNGTLFLLHDLSQTIDPYFMRNPTHQINSTPQLRLTNWWSDLLNYIERQQNPRWTEIGFILLNVDYEDQVQFEKNFKGVQKIVQRHWKKPDHKNMVMLSNGPKQRRDAIVGLAYKEISKEIRNQLMLDAGSRAIEYASSNQALIIGIDVGKSHYPYNVIACTYKSEV